jgi:hypothetical protein
MKVAVPAQGVEVSMKWSWKIGSYAGIGVYIHATFIMIQSAVAKAGGRFAVPAPSFKTQH